MTGKTKNPQQELDRIADALIEDLLSASDEEILAEEREDYGDPEIGATKAKEVYQRALIITGKRRLQAAKAALAAPKTAAATPQNNIVDMARARQFLKKIAANDPSMGEKITLAARNLDDLSDKDVERIINDLRELGAYPPSESNDF